MEPSPPVPDLSCAESHSTWDQIRHRIQAVQEALQRQLEPGPDASQTILRARARALAKPPDVVPSRTDWVEVVEFHLAYETYAVETRHVREIGVLKEICPLPGTPRFQLGLINIRGQILSVIDLKKFFGLPEKGLTDLNKVLVLRSPEMEVGVLADSILAVRLIACRDLEPPMPTISGIRANFVKAVTTGPVVLLDVDRILGDKTIVVNEG